MPVPAGYTVSRVGILRAMGPAQPTIPPGSWYPLPCRAIMPPRRADPGATGCYLPADDAEELGRTGRMADCLLRSWKQQDGCIQ